MDFPSEFFDNVDEPNTKPKSSTRTKKVKQKCPLCNGALKDQGFDLWSCLDCGRPFMNRNPAFASRVQRERNK